MMNRQQYLLVKVTEECIETAQRATKCATFGLDQRQEGQDLSNRERLYYEYNDLIAMLRLLGLPTEPNETKIALKTLKLRKYMALSVALGELEPQPDLVGIELPEPINRVDNSKEAYDKVVAWLDAQGGGAALNAIVEDGYDETIDWGRMLSRWQENLQSWEKPADGCKFHTS